MNVRRNLVANLLGQGWAALLNIAAVPIYLRLLGVESFGLLGLAIVVLVLASLLDGGMGQTLNRAMVHFHVGKVGRHETFDLLRSIEASIFGVALVASAGAFLAGPALASWLIDARGLPDFVVERSLLLIVIVALLRVIEGIYRSALLGLDRPILVNVLSAVSATVRIVAPLPVIVFAKGDVLTYFWLQLVIGLASLICFGTITHVVLEGTLFGKGHFRIILLRKLLGFAGAAVAISSLVSVANQLDKIAAARLTTLEDFGYYSAAATVATGIYQLVLPTFQSFYPKLSYLQAIEAQPEFDRLVLRMAQLVGFIAGVPIAVIVLNADEVVFAWTGSPAVAELTAPLLFWLCFGTLANGLFYVALAALLAAGQHKVAVVTTTVLLVALLPLLLLGWNIAGLIGLAAAWSSAMGCWCLVTLVLTARAITGARILLPLLAHSVAPFLIALLVGAVIRYIIQHDMRGQLVEILFTIVTAIAVGLLTAISLWSIERLRQSRGGAFE